MQAHFPLPFPFHRRIFSKISKYLTSMRTKIKGSCTCLYLNGPIFWMMMILLI